MDVARDGYILVQMVVDGKKSVAMLDTGSTNSMISMKAASDLSKTSRRRDKNWRMTPIGSKFTPTHSIRLISEGVGDKPAYSHCHRKFPQWVRGDLILGIGILRQLHLHIAYDEERLYITPASAN
jgi:hypothetical protein